MKKIVKNFGLILVVLLLGTVGMLFTACSEMDDTYDDFIADGQRIYPGKTDSLRVHPGRERLNLSWLASSDPKVEYARIYWNDRSDSIDVPLEEMVAGQDTVVVPFNGMAEGRYLFELFTFDGKGNRSVKAEILGQVYGDLYESRLLNRPIDDAELNNGTVTLTWGAAPDTTAIGSEVVYTDVDGVEQTLFVPESEAITEISEFAAPGTIQDRTLYVPHERALDTFYTDYTSRIVEEQLPPVFVDKSRWTITASSEDVAGGRTASNLIDGDLNTMFVNELGAGLTYPHWISVDMGQAVQVEGFYFHQRAFNRTKTVEVLTSMDGETWDSHGDFTLPNESGEPVFIHLHEPGDYRYFKHIYKDDYAGSNNVNIMEMGVYNRLPPPPMPIDKTDWSIEASSEDVNGGRTASNLIDGDVTNLYVNELGAGLSYPHTVKVDMREKIDGIEGFGIYQRSINQLKTLEILISDDGENWNSLGEFVISNTPTVNTSTPELAEPVMIEFPEPVSFRYFRHVYLNDYGNSNNVNIHEVDVYVQP